MKQPVVPLLTALALLAACAATTSVEVSRGQQAYLDFCAGCHGSDATGSGPAAEGMDPPPADLTTLAARNGGAFPATYAMSTIWGPNAATHEAAMPQFAALFEDDPLIPYDGGDGIQTPTPATLVELAEYLRTIQR